MGIAEEEGGLPVFDTDILNTFLPTAEITTQPPGKISSHTRTTEGLMLHASLAKHQNLSTDSVFDRHKPV